MDLNEAETLAHQLLDRHGLVGRGWTFGFDRGTHRLGATHYGRRLVTISRTMAETSDSGFVAQVLLHEIAHALLPDRRRDGSRIGHGPEWKRMARQIGYMGERTVGGAPSVGRRPPGLRLGDQVRSADGRTGTVTKVGRTRVHFRDGEGLTWAAHFENLTVVVAPIGGRS